MLLPLRSRPACSISALPLEYLNLHLYPTCLLARYPSLLRIPHQCEPNKAEKRDKGAVQLDKLPLILKTQMERRICHHLDSHGQMNLLKVFDDLPHQHLRVLHFPSKIFRTRRSNRSRLMSTERLASQLRQMSKIITLTPKYMTLMGMKKIQSRSMKGRLRSGSHPLLCRWTSIIQHHPIQFLPRCSRRLSMEPKNEPEAQCVLDSAYRMHGATL